MLSWQVLSTLGWMHWLIVRLLQVSRLPSGRLAASSIVMSLVSYRQWAGADLLYDPLGDRYIIEKIIQLQAAAAGSNRASAPEARERGDYARAVITELLQMREEWRHANCPGN